MKKPEQFTFDIYSELEAELDMAYEHRQVAEVDNRVAVGGLQAVVESKLSPEVSDTIDWARSQLEQPGMVDGRSYDSPLKVWNRYSAQVGVDIPRSLDELLVGQPNLVNNLERLHTAQLALETKEVKDAEDRLIEPNMRLVLIPWGAFRDVIKCRELNSFIGGIRTAQGIDHNDKGDCLDSYILDEIYAGTKMYRSPIKGNKRFSLSVKKYIDERLSMDGDWGIMLAQVSSWATELSDELIIDLGYGESKRHKRAQQKVDQMGILEWIALTTQFNPKDFKFQDACLLGNYYTDRDGDATLMEAGWDQSLDSDSVETVESDIDDVYVVRYGVM